MTQILDYKISNRGAARPVAVRVVGSILLMAVVAFLWWRYGSLTQRTDSTGVIFATGTIEATEVDVSAEIGGRIEELLVDEGLRIERGQHVARIEDSAIRPELLRAEAGHQSARAGLEDLEAGARSQELESARARLELSRATLELAGAEWKRAERLSREGVLSENQRDNAQSSLDVARSQYNAAEEELKLLEAGSRPAQIEAASWQVKQAEAAVQLAKVRLDKTKIYSPISGVVLVKFVEEGEVILPGVPIVTLADLDDMWVKIYIDELDIGKVTLGQSAKVRVDSFPDKEFIGEIIYISDEAEFTPKNIQTREDRVKLVFAVKVGIDNAGGLLKAGMYADIELKAMSPNAAAADIRP
jgi:HlyD family secretion protein